MECIQATTADQLFRFFVENSPAHRMISLKPVCKLGDELLGLLQIFERFKIVVTSHIGIREKTEHPLGIGWENSPKFKSLGL